MELKKTTAHMCRFGMRARDHLGEGLVKKPTGFMTDSPYLEAELSRLCDGTHRHVQLLGGRAKAAQVYPESLCRTILKRLEIAVDIGW